MFNSSIFLRVFGMWICCVYGLVFFTNLIMIVVEGEPVLSDLYVDFAFLMFVTGVGLIKATTGNRDEERGEVQQTHIRGFKDDWVDE